MSHKISIAVVHGILWKVDQQQEAAIIRLFWNNTVDQISKPNQVEKK